MQGEERNRFLYKGWILEPVRDYSLCTNFDCGDRDLNEFFHRDLIPHEKELLTRTYSLSVERVTVKQIVALISFCNDAIRLDPLRKKLTIADAKNYRNLPAVKIARIGVHKDHCGQGIGSQLLDMAKLFFLENNRTGCRILTVDAYNRPRVINFYAKNHFQLFDEKDHKGHDTRTMFYDLKSTDLSSFTR